MSNSEAFYHNDAGFYVGQTPPQTQAAADHAEEPELVGQRARLLGHELALRDDHAVEVLQQRRRHRARTSSSRRSSCRTRTTRSSTTTSSGTTSTTTRARRSRSAKAAEGLLYPVGTGVLLFGGRTTRVENNRIWGNYLLGYGQISQFLLTTEDKPLGLLEGNEVRGNEFGLRRRRPERARPVLRRHAAARTASRTTRSRARTCRPTTRRSSACGSPNAFNEGARNEAISWVTDTSHEAVLGAQPAQADLGHPAARALDRELPPPGGEVSPARGRRSGRRRRSTRHRPASRRRRRTSSRWATTTSPRRR